ncbi:MAG TPA: zinc-dependent alcohol dehydrogenase family protein [Actinomycetota bacterium]|nr:zinc-dependent alcohol dehydrogenase family protein [Actinomycetota bacterium]
MKAWEVISPGPVSEGPIRYVDRDPPVPGPREVLVRVSTCGVCRTDLHVVEGDLPVHKKNVIPGHEVVGVVEGHGEGASRFPKGARVGIAWVRSTCGVCRFCARGDENLCTQPHFTGYDDDGGYAELAVAHEDFVHEVPDAFDDLHAAPLLCAGIIGYRALKRSELPQGGRLGIYGFGGSAHIAAQVALYEGATVHVMTRAEEARDLARDLGVASVQGAYDAPSEPLDAAILFAPVGDLVPVAMEALDRGGRLSIAGIHLSQIPGLDYQRHLFQEREIVSVTANRRTDAREFLELAARIPVEVTPRPYPLDEADRALEDLAAGRLAGAAVLQV